MQLTAQVFGEVMDVLRLRGEDQGSERRRFTRTQLCANIRAAALLADRSARKYTALTRDISAGGVGLMQHFPSSPEDKLLIELPRKNGAIVVVAVVKFARALADQMFLAGTEFLSVADEEMVKAIWAGAETDQERIQKSILA